MSHKHHRSKGKTVQQMTRDGLVQENLATGEVKHISSRTAEQEFRHNSSGDTQDTAMQAPSASRHSVYQQDFSVRNTAEPAHNSQTDSSDSAAPGGQHSHSRYSQASLQQTTISTDAENISAVPSDTESTAMVSTTPKQPANHSVQDILYNKETLISDTTELGSFRQSAEQQRFNFQQSDTVSNSATPEPASMFHVDPVSQEFQTSHSEPRPAEQTTKHHQHSQYTQQQANFSATVTPEVKPYEPYPANQERENNEQSAYSLDAASPVPEKSQNRPVPEQIPYRHQESALGSFALATVEHHAGQARNYHESEQRDSYLEQHSREGFQTSHEQFHDSRYNPSHSGENTSNYNPTDSSGHQKQSRQPSVHRAAHSAMPDTRAVSDHVTSDAAYSSAKVHSQDNGIDPHIRIDPKPLTKGTASQQFFSASAAQQLDEKATVSTAASGAAHEKAPTLQSQHERLMQTSADTFRTNAERNQPGASKTSSKKCIRQEHCPDQSKSDAPTSPDHARSEAVIIAAPLTGTTGSLVKDNHVNLLHRQDKDSISEQRNDLNLRPTEKLRSGNTVGAKSTPVLQETHGHLQQNTSGLTDSFNAKSAPAETKKSVTSQKHPQEQQHRQKSSAPDVPKSDAAVTAAVVTPIVTAEQTQAVKPAKSDTAELSAVAAGKKSAESGKNNAIPIRHRVEKPEAAVSDQELDFNKRTTDKIPEKKKVAQKSPLRNRHQRIFQEQSEALKPEASTLLPAKDKAPPGKQSAEQKLLTRKELFKQKAAADSAHKTADSESLNAKIKPATNFSAKKVQGEKVADTKSAKKKSSDQSKQAARKKSRLQFTSEDETGKPGISGKMKSGVKAAAGLAIGAAGTVIHGKLHEAEQDNTAVEALHKTELLTERGIRTTKNLHSASRLHQEKVAAKKVSRLKESAAESQSVFHLGELEKKQVETKKKGLLNRFFQKQQNKRRAAEAARAAKNGTKSTAQTAKSTASAVERTATAIKDFAVSHKKAGIALVALLLLFAFLLTQLQSCSVIASQSLGSISASSWPAEDSEITQADLYYSKLEAELQYKVDHIESSHSGCDEYNYNIGEIGHDPVVLISYLCAKYGDFTFNREIKRELESLFAQQYHLTEEVKNETRTITKSVRVGESLGNVVTSGYCNCSICCGQWSGGPTASGAYPQANHTIAVDASNPFVPMGTKVVMNGVEYTVEDTGAFDQYGVQFDVYYDNHAAASAHGHQTWEAYIADDNGSQTVDVTTTENVKACYVTLTSTDLSVLVNSLMDTDQKERYAIYTSSRGNRCFLGSPFETNWRGNVSSYFGYRTSPTTGEVKMHEGLDIAMPAGTQILSVQDGTVQTSGYSSSYGNYIVIKNDDGYQTLYAHCQTLNVSAGQAVEEGDVIAAVGSTGNSTGNHLHIEFRYKGDLYNPYLYLNTGSGSAYSGGAALTTEAQQKLFAEAEKYLGMPYVWGGSSPSTGFDCSGFVSYVFTASGVYNMGRLTAQGIYDICTPISASEAQPGDIIFFKGTYNTSEVSHVGIYAGNGKMLHCGDPIQYTSIETSYWQSHFYAFGRLS